MMKLARRTGKGHSALNESDEKFTESTKLTKDLKSATSLRGVRYDLEQESRNDKRHHSVSFDSRKKALYTSARNGAKEIVKYTSNSMECVQNMLSDMRSQEIGLKKYYDDSQSVITSNKDSFDNLAVLYLSVWKELGQIRSAKLEGASTMLKNNPHRREEVLKDISRTARQQLEQIKQQEKDAEDASALIDRYKNLVRT